MGLFTDNDHKGCLKRQKERERGREKCLRNIIKEPRTYSLVKILNNSSKSAFKRATENLRMAAPEHWTHWILDFMSARKS